MNRERRRALGIPVHDTEAEHSFVDGYCTCGARRRPERKTKGRLPPGGRRAGKSNLDAIEHNWSEYR